MVSWFFLDDDDPDRPEKGKKILKDMWMREDMSSKRIELWCRRAIKTTESVDLVLLTGRFAGRQWE